VAGVPDDRDRDPAAGTVVQRKDIIESNKRRIVRKQERELRRQQRKQLPPSAPA
jgi:hypothetical protein